MMTLRFSARNTPAIIGSKNSLRTAKANTAMMAPMANDPVSPINISATVNKNLNSNYSNQSTTQLTNDEFPYKVVGYRAGETNRSVVLRKADVDYVVQQGDLLDNTYRLIYVSKNAIVFDRAGKQIYIKID